MYHASIRQGARHQDDIVAACAIDDVRAAPPLVASNPQIVSNYPYLVSPDIADSYSTVGDLLEGRDRSADFRWESDLSECAAATIAAAVLATMSDGIFYDPQEDVAYHDVAALIIAQQTIQEIDRYRGDFGS